MGAVLGLAVNFICLLSISLHAQTRNLDQLYEKDKFTVGSQSIQAYVADNSSRREQGLMHIAQIPENVGMVFVFDDVQPLTFWMKNTIIDLSIGYFDAQGVLIDILEMKATSVMDKQPPTYPSSGPAVFALEMNANWFTKHGVTRGAKLQLVGATKSALLKRQLAAGKSSSRQ